ncbi:hypothetical protein HC024_01015 [Methylococcaceae bacterium WWC4]|nr:hypothetical protein [Methylococcaceae bacterium WWC4]
MKTTKKRGKQLLRDIEGQAGELAMLTDGLSLLSELHTLARRVVELVNTLTVQTEDLKKKHYLSALISSEALGELTEIADTDAASQLEDRLFAANADSPVASDRFFQELLEKIDARFARLTDAIQDLLHLAQPDPDRDDD